MQGGAIGVWHPHIDRDAIDHLGGAMTGSGLQKLAFFLLVAFILYATITASGA